MRRGVGVELDVRRGGAARLRGFPTRLGRRVRGRIRGLDLLQVAVDVTREVALVHAARQVAELDGNVRGGGGRSPRAPTNRAACAGHEQHGDGGEGCAHAAYCKGRDSGSLLLKWCRAHVGWECGNMQAASICSTTCRPPSLNTSAAFSWKPTAARPPSPPITPTSPR